MLSIEKMVFHGDDFWERYRLWGAGERPVCGTPCITFPDDELNCPAQFAHHSSLKNQQSAIAIITAGLTLSV